MAHTHSSNAKSKKVNLHYTCLFTKTKMKCCEIIFLCRYSPSTTTTSSSSSSNCHLSSLTVSRAVQSDSITEDKDWDFYESIEQERCNSNQGPGGPEGMKLEIICVFKSHLFQSYSVQIVQLRMTFRPFLNIKEGKTRTVSLSFVIAGRKKHECY